MLKINENTECIGLDDYKNLNLDDVYSIAWNTYSTYLHEMYTFSASLYIYTKLYNRALKLERTSFTQDDDIELFYNEISQKTYHARLNHYKNKIDGNQKLQYKSVVFDLNGFLIHGNGAIPLQNIIIRGQYIMAKNSFSIFNRLRIKIDIDPDIITAISTDPSILLNT